MRKYKIFLSGVISLLIFGLLLPQPIQALLVLVESPVKDYFSRHLILLCMVVGILQGLFEEVGYYLVFRTMLKKEKTIETPILFGLGRSGFHTIFDIGTICFTRKSILWCVIALGGRILSFGALMGLTFIDYIAIEKNQIVFLAVSVLLHSIMNGVLYANELNLLNVNNNFDTLFMSVFSYFVIIFAFLLVRFAKKRV